MRTCTKCQRSYTSIEAFYPSYRKGGGYSTVCKTCRSEKTKLWYAANRDKRLAQHKDWNLANKERRRTDGKIWHAANKERRLVDMKSWYRANKTRHQALGKETKKARKDVLRDYVNQAKSGPCTDCGGLYPYYVMEFDHVRGKKVASVNRLLASRASISRLKVEIEKCEVVCSNCHRGRSYRRKFEVMDDQKED